MKRLVLLLLILVGSLKAISWQTVSGTQRTSLWQDISYFSQSSLEHKNFQVGFYQGEKSLVFGEAYHEETFFVIQAGHLRNSLDSGFLLANGGFFPQFAALAPKRPLGSHLTLKQSDFFSLRGAYYELPQFASRLTMAESTLAFTEYLFLTLGWLDISSMSKIYFAHSKLMLTKNFNTSFVIKESRDWQADLNWRGYGVYVSLLAFQQKKENPFQAGIYQRYSQAVHLFIEQENFILRHLVVPQGYRTTGQLRLAGAGLFHLSQQQKISLSGLYYENPQLGFHPLLHGYQSHIDNSWQIAVGVNYGKLVKIAWLTGWARKYHPVDPVFWPAFHDISNMREDNLLYFCNTLRALELAVESQGFSFYGLAYQPAKSKLQALFRFGFSYLLDAG